MLAFFWITLTIASLGGTAVEQPAAAIAPEQIYNAAERPFMIRVEGEQRVQLALMDHEGVLLAEPVAVRPGRVDLAEVFPYLWLLRETAYLQVVDVEDELVSYGSAVVLQPMVTPGAAIAETEIHPLTDVRSTRIVGWEAPPAGAFSGFRAYVEHDVQFETSHGLIRIALRPDQAPNTAWNFRQLVEGGFYDGVLFHRIIPLTADGDPFIMQSGDPTGTGIGGPGYHIDLEPSGLEHNFGVISMARGDEPHSAGSQFFICLSREGTARLDGQYAAFGYAVDGARTIVSIADVELADIAAGRPARPPVIQRATLLPAPPRIIGTGRPDQRVTLEEIQPPSAAPEPEPRRVPR